MAEEDGKTDQYLAAVHDGRNTASVKLLAL